MKQTLGSLAEQLGAKLEGDPNIEISRVRSLESAGTGDITYLAAGRPFPESGCNASAVIVAEDLDRSTLPDESALLVMPNPRLGFQRVLDIVSPPPPPPFEGVSSTAEIDASAEIGTDVRVAANVTISAGAKIGNRVVIYPGVFVGPRSTIADDVVLYANVSVYAFTEIGARSIVHAGAVIGSDGFGFEPTPKGAAKIQHVGNVRIETDVEIGANCTIDRGVIDSTVIGTGCKLDNMVHIAHNVVLGPHCMLAAQVGIAGSTRVGSGVLMGGRAGVAGHLTIGDGAQIGGGSGVTDSVPAGEKVFGYPALDFRTAGRAHATFKELPELRRKLQRTMEEFTQRIEKLLGD